MLRATPRLAVGILALGTLLSPALARDGADKVEKAAQKQRTKIAEVWLQLGRDLARADLEAEARDALDRAQALDPALPGLEALDAQVRDLPGAGTPTESHRRRIAKARSAAAKGYERLARVYDGSDAVAAMRHRVTALELDPGKKRLMALAGPAKAAPFLLVSPTHAAAAYVSLPRSWKPGASYPVLVSVDGAGANFKGNAAAFRSGRGSRPFITVAPHALSCTNAIDAKKFPAYTQELIDAWNTKRTAFDVPGLLALLDFLHAHFGAERQVAITGFSGGGNLCYGFLLRHPDRVLCAAPACANFQPGLAQGAKTPDGGGPRVHILTGAEDPHRHLTHGKTPPGIEEQTDWAVKALAENGFEHVERTMLPGVGHSSLVKQVWDFVDEVRGR